MKLFNNIFSVIRAFEKEKFWVSLVKSWTTFSLILSHGILFSSSFLFCSFLVLEFMIISSVSFFIFAFYFCKRCCLGALMFKTEGCQTQIPRCVVVWKIIFHITVIKLDQTVPQPLMCMQLILWKDRNCSQQLQNCPAQSSCCVGFYPPTDNVKHIYCCVHSAALIRERRKLFKTTRHS